MQVFLEIGKFLFFLAIIYLSIGPVGTSDGGFKSDTAIPVIMATSSELTPFHLYYFGQDRLGGWPFIVQWLINQLLPITLGARFCFLFQSAFVAGAGLCIRRIFPKVPASGCLFILATLIHPDVRKYFHEINNPYAYQTALCVFYWFISIHLLKDRNITYTSMAGLILFCFLAVWTSNASILFLGIIPFYECRWSINSSIGKRRYLFYGIPFAALGMESVIKKIYLGFVNREYANELANLNFSVQTNAHIQLDDFWNNFLKAMGNIAESYTPVWVVLLAITCGLVLIKPFRINSKKIKVFHLDPARMLALLFVVGSSTIVISMVSWVRLNGHSIRYGVPQLFWMNFIILAAISGTGFALLKKGQVKAKEIAFTALGTAALVISAIDMGALKNRQTKYEFLEKISHAIGNSSQSSKVLVLDTYVNSYIWQGLYPEKVIGQPIKSHIMRIPDNLKLLEIIPVVSCRDPSSGVLTEFGIKFRRGPIVRSSRNLETMHPSCQFYRMFQASKGETH